jgi:hypothetical protein
MADEGVEQPPAAGYQAATTAGPDVDPKRLASLYAAYNERTTFAPGDLVRWKPGLRNKELPEYSLPAVVMDVLEDPVTDDFHGPNTPYFRERLDIALGVIDPDDDLVVFHYDSARFERFPSES